MKAKKLSLVNAVTCGRGRNEAHEWPRKRQQQVTGVQESSWRAQSIRETKELTHRTPFRFDQRLRLTLRCGLRHWWLLAVLRDLLPTQNTARGNKIMSTISVAAVDC